MRTDRYILAVILAAALGACADEVAPPDKSVTLAGIPAERLDRIVSQFNKGVGLMDRYRPAEAVKAFEEVVKLAPGWISGHLNLGIALLNSQGEENYARAERVLRAVTAADPENPHAHYALGMLLRHLTRMDEARTHFAQVLEIDPEDPDAHYQLGILLIDEDPQAARDHLEKTLARVPHHESACYRLQTLLRQAGEKQRALELLRRFKALKTAKAGVFSGMKYGEMGRYAEVIRAFELPRTKGMEPPSPPAFVDRAEDSGLTLPGMGSAEWPCESSRSPGPPAFGPGVGVSDVDGDGDLDVYLCGLETGGVLYLSQGGRFEPAPDTGIDGRDAVGAWFADHDRDGDPDLYLSCAGPNRLYQNDGAGRFRDVTEASGTGGGSMLSLGAAWADADHDGDLDLYVCNFASWPPETELGAPNALFRNNGNGTFEELAAEAGIDGGVAPSTSVVFLDVDDDRDLDIYVVSHRAPNRLFLNDRVGRFRDASEWFPGLADAGQGLGALAGDVDHNGLEDLVLLRGTDPPRLFKQPDRGRFEEDPAFRKSVQGLGAAAGILADLDLDGSLDLVLLGAGGARTRHRVLMNDGDGGFDLQVPFGNERGKPDARGSVAADFDGDGSLELLVARAGARPELWRAPPPRGRHWLRVVPAKLNAKNRREPVALGLQIEVKTGQRFQVGRIRSSSGYLACPPARGHFGLGVHGKADYVRLVWPDAALQSELEVAADQDWSVKKVLRKPSSCPLLFSWDGERFAFVTDFLGVGGLGFFLSPGEYAAPDPTEDVRIPPELVEAQAGRYLLRIAEPLEEVLYLDELELLVYEHPRAQEVHPDERFTGAPPFPVGRPHVVEQKIFPAAARNDRGENVLDRILHIDRRYVEPPKDERFVGYAKDHWLELDFGSRLRDTGREKPLVLCLHGWVEYSYSHVNYAASQAGLVMRVPSIEVPDGKGGWKVAMQNAGFPAGLPRMMTLDVSELPIREQGRFRIRSNMELFWDQVFLAEDRSGAGLRVSRLRPEVAELRRLGFPQEFSPDGSDPTLYDYHRIDQSPPYKNLTGAFTSFGDVRPLLEAADDRFVIMGRGEEIALEFDASSLPPLREGWSRTLVLHCDGYCKDMDLYTAFPDSVGPLPYHAMENYPPGRPFPAAEALRESMKAWNTRRVLGR